MREKIVVLDFGSQYAHLIAKRLRFLGYYSEIALPSSDSAVFKGVKGIILSGGPSSVYEKNIPICNHAIFDLDIPILGLCYGHQLMAQHYGGTVEKADVGEFGIAQLSVKNCAPSPLFEGINFLGSTMSEQVWMSHQDTVTLCPDGFERVGFTAHCTFAALQNSKKKRFSVQFHAEVKDTPCGDTIFANFARFCDMEQNWNQDAVLELILQNIVKEVAERNVLLFLSGGVDSTVVFALLNKALGTERVLGLHIDNGFMRKDESKIIAERYRNFGFTNFIVEDASEQFLHAVYKKTDPQKKRHAIGEAFITIRDTVIAKQKLDSGCWLLAQGTLYPDIIESGGAKNAHVIKTHHNRVKGIQALIEQGLVIEPLKDLYKDEVRTIGLKLNLSTELIMRHPFPGPGLAINVLCSTGTLIGEDKTKKTGLEEFTAAKAEVATLDLSECFKESLQKDIPIPKIRVLPVKSVGVQGDFRTYRFPAVLDFGHIRIPHSTLWNTLESTSSFITNSLSCVNRTVLCIYEKEGCLLAEAYCTKDRLDHTREVDAIVLDELKKTGWYTKIFQHLTINIPYCAEDGHCSIVLRPIVSEDVMTARFAHIDKTVLQAIIARIQGLGFVDALYYDITNKPPATFGWE